MEKFSPEWFEAKRLAREAIDKGELPIKQPEVVEEKSVKTASKKKK